MGIPEASAVSQLVCKDTECSQDCDPNGQWKLNECYNVSGGGSQIFLSCDGTSGINGLVYTNTSCQGQGQNQNMDVGKCLNSSTGDSFINTCVTGLVFDTTHDAASVTIMVHKTAPQVKAALSPEASAVSQLVCKDLSAAKTATPMASGNSTSVTTSQEAAARSSPLAMAPVALKVSSILTPTAKDKARI